MTIHSIILLIFSITFFSNAYAAEYRLEPGTFEITHNRQDLKFEKLWLSSYCFNSDGTMATEDCMAITAHGKKVDGLIELIASASQPNTVATPQLTINFHKGAGKFFCIGMKVLFEGFPNQCDDVLYIDHADRYSILAFCNVENLPGDLATNPRFSHRRARTWSEFATSFHRTIPLQLTTNLMPKWCD